MDAETAIMTCLAARAPGATICPSEAARLAWPNGWRARMDEMRLAGRELATKGVIAVTQGGAVVDPNLARGPIRYRRAQP